MQVLICTILMQGQMEIAVPVLPFPLQGLGNAYISLPRLAWISCQRVRHGMGMRKGVVFWNTHIRNIPLSLAEGTETSWGSHRTEWGLALSIWHQHFSFCSQEVSTAGPQGEGLGLKNCVFFPSSLGTATLWALDTWMSRGSSSQPRPLMFPSLVQGWFLLTSLSSGFGCVIWNFSVLGWCFITNHCILLHKINSCWRCLYMSVNHN